MRIGFQIFQCPISDTVRTSLEAIVLSDKTFKYPSSFKFGNCAIEWAEILGTCFIRHMSPQDILFIFCKKLEVGLSLMEIKLNENFMIEKNKKMNEQARYR